MGAHISIPAYKRSLAQRYALWGLKCEACGAAVYPPKGCCPFCGARGKMMPLKLKPQGEVVSITEITAAGAPPEFGEFARTRRSYAVALVRLDDGPTVMAQIASSRRPPGIGARVKAVFKRIYVEEHVIRYGLKFEWAEADIE